MEKIRPCHQVAANSLSSQLLHLKEDRKIRGVIQLRFAGFKVPMILFEVRGILMIPVSSLLLQIAALTPARNHSLATQNQTRKQIFDGSSCSNCSSCSCRVRHPIIAWSPIYGGSHKRFSLSSVLGLARFSLVYKQEFDNIGFCLKKEK